MDILMDLDLVGQTADSAAAMTADILTDAAAGRQVMYERAHVRALTFNDGWDLWFAMGSPGLIRSMAALWGWKAARATVQATDVDYN